MEKRFQTVGFEELVLMAVARLGEEADAVSIRDTVEKMANRRATFGAIYTTLDRLEEKGFITVRQGEPTPERGGRARRFFRIEGAGILALQEGQQIRERMLFGVNLGLKPAGGTA